jgi:hypothetical protein
MPDVLLPPPPTRPIEVPSPKRTSARVGVPPNLFLYVTVNLKDVVGVPAVGETAGSTKVTLPSGQEMVTPRTGATNTNRDAATQRVSASAPPNLTRVPLAP